MHDLGGEHCTKGQNKGGGALAGGGFLWFLGRAALFALKIAPEAYTSLSSCICWRSRGLALFFLPLGSLSTEIQT